MVGDPRRLYHGIWVTVSRRVHVRARYQWHGDAGSRQFRHGRGHVCRGNGISCLAGMTFQGPWAGWENMCSGMLADYKESILPGLGSWLYKLVLLIRTIADECRHL